MEASGLETVILELEQSLLHTDFSNAQDTLESRLATEFREVNPDGRDVSRQQVVAWLLAKNPLDRWQFANFGISILAQGLVLATYHARQVKPHKPGSTGAKHISIWQKNRQDQWQMLFHQSTRIADRQ